MMLIGKCGGGKAGVVQNGGRWVMLHCLREKGVAPLSWRVKINVVERLIAK
jgi:hypothetical protein